MMQAVSTSSDGNLAFQHGPAEEVLSHRSRFLSKLGVSLDQTVACANQHSDELAVVDAADGGRGMRSLESAPAADALLTRERGVALFLLTADCIPLLLIDQEETCLALAHASWKTATLDLPIKAVKSMKTKTERVKAVFGPSIHAASYLLPGPLEQENDPRWHDFLQRRADGQIAIDLVGFTARQLERAGVRPENIQFSPIDTAVDRRYFSHYRSVRSGEPEGRFATVAMLGA